MARDHERWDPAGRASAYTELEHPSDLLLEIRGADPADLLEHALFAFYDQIAEIEGFAARRELTLSVRGAGLDEALRSLLSEALYHFDTEGFVAAGAEVTIERGPTDDVRPTGDARPAGDGEAGQGSAGAGPGPAPGEGALRLSTEWRVSARLWGDTARAKRQVLLREVKAVTYHRLSATRSDKGWKATVLLDI